MSSPVGKRVRIKALGKQGIVKDAPRPGILTIQIGKLLLHCKEGDLVFTEDEPKENKRPVAERGSSPRPPKRTAAPPPRMDLHGMRVEEAIPKVEQYVSDAVMAGMDRIEILHGIGTGRLKAAIHRALTSFPTVHSFKVEEGNPGVTVVYL